MKLVYFSWVREKIGTDREEIHPPADIATVNDLIAWLKKQGEGYEAAFADMSGIRAAVNQEYSKLDVAVGADDEVAFFPPVTGG